MALSQNAFIRRFNSIYQQAPRIQIADKKDFVGYCIAWVDCVAQHHHYEEMEFIQVLNKAAGKNDLMRTAVDQHSMSLLYILIENFLVWLMHSQPPFMMVSSNSKAIFKKGPTSQGRISLPSWTRSKTNCKLT